jgi:hypothetical protein
MEPNWGHNRGLETRWLGELDLEDLPRFLGGLGWFVMDIPRGLGGPGQFLRDVPRGLRGPGRFLRDVPRGLGGRVGQERESTRAEDGSGDASWATRGEEKGGNSQVTEGWRSIWICGSVYKGIYRTLGKRSKLYLSQPGGPWRAGSGGY